MKNKLNTNLYRIILLIVFILIVLGFVFGLINIKQTEEIDKLKIKNSYALQEQIDQMSLNGEIISFDNCDYEYTSNGGIRLREYVGNADSVIIPKEINGLKVEDIYPDTFDNNDDLEKIQIHASLAERVEGLNNFKRKETISNSEYIAYTTTKEYNEAYLYYINLPDEEKSKYKVIPPKFIVDLEQLDFEEVSDFYQPIGSKAAAENIPTSYDLRKYIDIKVENQGEFGTCYAYTTLDMVETYIAKKLSETRDFSELHLALMSKQGYGGDSLNSYNDYLAKGYGPIDESTWNKDVNKNKYDISKITNYCLGKNVAESEIDKIIEQVKSTGSVPEYYVFGLTRITTMYGDYKKTGSETVIKENRNRIKSHIMDKGAVNVIIANPQQYADMYNGNMVMNTTTSMDTSYNEWHEVSIIGWDDNFSSSKFPKSMGVTSNGAYLALNSWGDSWGNKRIFLDIL